MLPPALTSFLPPKSCLKGEEQGWSPVCNQTQWLKWIPSYSKCPSTGSKFSLLLIMRHLFLKGNFKNIAHEMHFAWNSLWILPLATKQQAQLDRLRSPASQLYPVATRQMYPTRLICFVILGTNLIMINQSSSFSPTLLLKVDHTDKVWFKYIFQ